MNKTILWCLIALFSGPAFADHHSQPTVFGRYYAMDVSDPAAVVAAMQKYWDSATGKKLNGDVTLSAVIANGRDEASHTVSVFYESAAAMEADMATARGSKDAADFPGNIIMGEILAMGETPGTHWVSFLSKDMATLLNGVEAFMKSDDFAKYARYAKEFRKVEARYISRAVLVRSE